MWGFTMCTWHTPIIAQQSNHSWLWLALLFPFFCSFVGLSLLDMQYCKRWRNVTFTLMSTLKYFLYLTFKMSNAILSNSFTQIYLSTQMVGQPSFSLLTFFFLNWIKPPVSAPGDGTWVRWIRLVLIPTYFFHRQRKVIYYFKQCNC